MRTPFLLLVITFLILSCAEDNKILVFSEETITTPENSIVHITIPKAEGIDSIAEKINSKIEAFISKAIAVGDPDKAPIALSAQIDSFNIQYAKFKEEFPDPPLIWEAQIDGEVLYQSEELITVALTTYTNTGGAHGITTISFLNFNASSGEAIDNQMLFNNSGAVLKIAYSHFINEIKGRESNYYNLDDFQYPTNIGFSEDGLVFLYNVYEIAPYATGITEFNVPFNEVESYLNYH